MNVRQTAALLAWLGLAAPLRAQTLPSEPIALANGRVTVAGDVSASFGSSDPGFFNYTDYEHSALRLLRIDVSAVVKAGPHLSLLGEVRTENVDSVQAYALYARIKGLADQLEHPQSAIFNLHVPPHASGLDTAFEIDDQLRIVVRDGKPHEMPVGSTAVRQILEEYQPLVALHGHIHESRGAAQIGRTLALNSGSEYASGRIHGVTVSLAGDRVRSHQFTIG